jgi:ADP-dependent NAD(P)H-hydrate dehydratase / NAD(P)H-hydrate epimerase
MMASRLVTAEQMRGLDLKASREFGIPSIVLMENAARSVCEVIEDYFQEEECKCQGMRDLKVLIFCGKGSNGGDGLAVARLLANRGCRVSVVLLGAGTELRGDSKINYDILKHSEVICTSAISARQVDRCLSDLGDPDVIVDAIFGTGFKGKPAGLFAHAIEKINESDALVVAVDIPSGVQADDGRVEGVAVQADATVSMALLKRGHALFPGKEYCGDVWIGDIGVPQGQLAKGGDTFLLDADDVRRILPVRPADGHKGTFGTALTIAGSPGYTGAASLAAAAALRVGCGLSKVAVPQGSLGVVESTVREVVKFGLPQTPAGAFRAEALPRVRELLVATDVLALGPGMGTLPETRDFELKLLREIKIPVVIDADGINNLAQHTEILETLKAPVVMTPHPGELSRLVGLPPQQINDDRIEVCRRYAEEFGVVLIIKGAPTVVASPENVVWVNPTGNSGLGSGGTGDVLTGMIAGLIAQGLPALDAAQVGVYLHGLAADLAAEDKTEYSLMAGDLLEYIPEAIKALTRERE